MMPPSQTAVLLDEHPLWLDSVEQAVRRAGVDVVGRETLPSRALPLLAELAPDLLVTGLRTPEGEADGIDFLISARAQAPELKIVVLSMYSDLEHINAALDAGATAYVLKTAHPDDLISAIRQAFWHSIYLGHARPASAPQPRSTVEPSGLTRRELEILQLVAAGHSNVQVAGMLWVTEQTVKFHLSNIYRKLRVANRTEASRIAHLRGLLTDVRPLEATA
jgi:DNA-binding NarL/FixJ family response regulator